MYIYATQIPAFVSSASVAIDRIESAIYTADEYFQAVIAPRLIHTAILSAEGLVIAFNLFIRAAYLTFIAGQNAADWYRAWFSSYCADAIPYVFTDIIIEPTPMIAAPVIAGLLPAQTLTHPSKVRQIRQSQKVGATVACRLVALSGDRVLITPVPEQLTRAAVSIAKIDMGDMGIRELRNLAKERGFKNYSKMSKATLTSLLAV